MKSRRKKFTTMYGGEASKKKVAKKAALGSGSRFAALKARLGARTGKSKVSDPAALAAYIGRKKYGSKRFAQLGAQGKRSA